MQFVCSCTIVADVESIMADVESIVADAVRFD